MSKRDKGGMYTYFELEPGQGTSAGIEGEIDNALESINNWSKAVSEELSPVGGTKFDQGKLQLDLIPPEAVLALGRVLTFGAAKYNSHNWRGGIKYSRVSAALLRHLMAWESGEDLDPESGFSHIDHVICNAAFLATFISENRVELDDRYKKDIS